MDSQYAHGAGSKNSAPAPMIAAISRTLATAASFPHGHRAVGGSSDTQPLSPLIKWVLPCGVIALTVALIGGYEFHWSWTGVRPSDQLWDLLHVIVLPVVLATLPIWYRTRQRWTMEWRVVFGIVAVTFAILVIGATR